MARRTVFEAPMKYLCLVYIEEEKLEALSKEEMDALVAEALAYKEELRKSGHHIASDALQPVETATTLRVRDGRLSITDGPFAETKEQLGGYYVIDVPNLDKALEWAARCPSAATGAVEVRPNLKM